MFCQVWLTLISIEGGCPGSVKTANRSETSSKAPLTFQTSCEPDGSNGNARLDEWLSGTMEHRAATAPATTVASGTDMSLCELSYLY